MTRGLTAATSSPRDVVEFTIGKRPIDAAVSTHANAADSAVARAESTESTVGGDRHQPQVEVERPELQPSG